MSLRYTVDCDQKSEKKLENELEENKSFTSEKSMKPQSPRSPLANNGFGRLIQEEFEIPKRWTTVQTFNQIPESNLSKIPLEDNLYTGEDNENFLGVKTEDLNLQSYIQIRLKSPLEKADDLSDKWPLLEIRKAILRIANGFSELCRIITKSKVFQVVVIVVILFNTAILAIEDPTVSLLPSPYLEIDLFFVYFYTVEFAMLISANGVFLPERSYFRDGWNLLDFTILVTAWLSAFAGSGFRLSSLRSLRILRPLRSISSIRGMKAIFLSLMNSIKPLLSALMILFFFILIFAIGAVQLWMGTLKYDCIEIATGMSDPSSIVCGVYKCSEGFECAYTGSNPNYGATNTDNILISLVTTFQIITLEGWSTNMIYNMTSFSYFSVLYYIPLLFIAAYLILNLTLAIITASFQDIINTIPDNDRNAIDRVSDTLFREIYKNTIIVETEESNDKKKGFLTENGEKRCYMTEEYMKVSNGQDNLDESYKSDHEEISIDDNFNFNLLIEKNSVAATNVTKKSVITSGRYKHESARESNYNSIIEPENTVKSGTLNVEKSDSRQFLTGFQPELDRIRKEPKDHSKLKRAVTIKHQTLISLQRDPSNIKRSILEVVEKYVLDSDSRIDVIPLCDKSSHPDIMTFRYQDPKKKAQKLNPNRQKQLELKEKYPEFDSKFQLFFWLILRFQEQNAFRIIRFYAKEFIHDSLNISIEGEWSGFDVNKRINQKNQDLLKKLSSMSFRLWSRGMLGRWEQLKYPLKVFINSKYVSYLILAAVLVNTGVLSYDHYGISPYQSSLLDLMNTFFTYFFFVALVLNIAGNGIKLFLRDFMNYIDAVVVILSMIELFLVTASGGSVNGFRVIRIFRIFRVVRVARIFRYMSSLNHIIGALGHSISNLLYLFLIIMLFQLIFTLLGMQVFGGAFNFPQGLPYGNYDTFHWAFVTTFQILSTENWNDELTSSLRSNAGPASCLLLIVWLILGNYILLNLFLAILVDGFSQEDSDNQLNDATIKLSSKLQKKIKDLDEFEDSDSESPEKERVQRIFSNYDRLECEFSFFIFSKKNPVRVSCYKIHQSQYFDHFMLFIIFLSAVKLTWETYILGYPSSSSEVILSTNFDIFFTICFILEVVLKSIAVGLVIEPNTYLRDGWNILDFLIAIISLIDISVSAVNVPVIKVFRVVRALRPLKLIKHNLSLKIVITALFESMPAILNVMLIIFIVWLMFAILGVSLLGGKMYNCSDPSITTLMECTEQGYTWINTNSNFDSVYRAFVVLFIIMSQESWPNRMLEGCNSVGVGMAQVHNGNQYIAYYYIVYLMVSNFFLLNLFTVVVFESFNQAKKNESSIAALLLTKDQLAWTEVQQMILKAKPGIEDVRVPKQRIRLFMYSLAKNKKFHNSIMCVILINMIVMAMSYDGASATYLATLDYVNIACTAVFVIEAAIKITGLGKNYFGSSWNQFDFFIVVTSIADIVITYALATSIPLLRQGPQLLRVLRILRVSRLFRLIKSLETLQSLLTILRYALPAILNVMGLIMLFFFIYAVLGSFLFYTVNNGVEINQFYNFFNFSNSMLILWRISTGEDYPILMYDCMMQTGSFAVVIYFCSFVAFIDWVMIDLFIAIILQYYKEFSNNPDHSVQQFTKDLKIFKKWWFTCNIELSNWKVAKEGLKEIVWNVSKELELITDDSSLGLIKFIGSMNIEMDNEGFFYFNDILFGLLKKKYTKKIEKRGKYSAKILRVEETRTKRGLAHIRESYRGKSEKQEIGQNLFINTIMLKGIFRSWKNFAVRLKQSPRSITPQFSEIEDPGENSLEVVDL